MVIRFEYGQDVLYRRGAGSLVALALCISTGARLYQQFGRTNSRAPISSLRGSAPRRLPNHPDYVSALAFSPDGKILATETGRPEQTVLLWDTGDWKVMRSLPQGRTDGIRCLCFSPDGHLLAVGAFDQPIGIWDVSTGKVLHRLTGLAIPLSLSFSPDGKTLAGGTVGHPVQFWDVNSGKAIFQLSGRRPVAFSPDGKLFTAASPENDGEGIIWNTASWQPITTLKGHLSPLKCMRFSPDSKTVATCSLDYTARLWDAQTGQQLRRFGGHQMAPYGLAFSPDGKILATADWRVFLWNPATGRKIKTLSGAPPREAFAVNCLDISPDGKTLAAGRKGVVEIWDLPVR